MEPLVDDGFKWFGEGFDGFPKRLPEDTVEYLIFTNDDQQQTRSQTRSRLGEVLDVVNESIEQLLKDYIWQRDSFNLKLAGLEDTTADRPSPEETTSQRKIVPSHLRGRTCFGESIADEWLIVYLLLELSRKCPNLYIRVFDNDGEFLLIEAANALPRWLNPDIAENRVWLSNGHLKLIPLDASNTTQKNLNLGEAVDFVQNHADQLVISPFVEDAAFARLKEYPAAIQESLHHAVISIPRKLAYLVHTNPGYIPPAIEAFYLRDAVALEPLATKDISTLCLPPEDFVSISTKFTRVGYAQLQSQVFDAPPAWVGTLPKLHDKQFQVGMKLTCGFEMLLADRINQDKKAVREINLLLEDLQNGDAALPTDQDICEWSSRQDDEKWLDISFEDFETELSSKQRNHGSGDAKAEGDVEHDTAQANLRKMVAQFQDFMNDESTGIDGVDDENIDDDDSSISSTGEDKDGSFDEAEFEQAMTEMMGMSEQQRQDNGLLEEARRLALDDEDDAEDDIDEETKKVMELMERELQDRGALGQTRSRNNNVMKSKQKAVSFGPELPPGFKRAGESDQSNNSAEEEIEDIGSGDGELSSDDEDYNDVDLNLARNLLQSFKGQAGSSGPAGNMMRAMGINMPRDEGNDRRVKPG